MSLIDSQRKMEYHLLTFIIKWNVTYYTYNIECHLFALKISLMSKSYIQHKIEKKNCQKIEIF